ncbi:MAG: GIDE domain-containing protein [Desulfuromonadales bacterium]
MKEAAQNNRPEGADPITQLIVRQRAVSDEDLAPLLQALQEESGLDPYTTRQRLIGPGLALLGEVGRQKATRITALLQAAGFACWPIVPQVPAFAPRRLRGLAIEDAAVVFDCEGGPVRLPRGGRVVGVLADLSGDLVDKHIKRLLAQKAYRGAEVFEMLAPDEIVRTIYRGHPVYDVYLLADDGTIAQAVRVLPGRFNVDGLGSRAGMSTQQNLAAVMALVEEYAGGDQRLHSDFGLSQLPQCQVRRLDESSGALAANLDSLTRYGWLVARLQGDGRSAEGSPPVNDATLTAAVVATALAGPAGAVIGSISAASAGPAFADIANTLSQKVTEASPAPKEPPVQDAGRPGLPPPPERPDSPGVLGRRLLLIGGFIGGLLIALTAADRDLFHWVNRYGLATGIIPALFALFFFLAGFHFVRLKRRVENTPTSKVRSLAMGMVEVYGRACRLYALVAPMTQSACVWYRLRKYRKDSKNKWRLTKEINSNHVPFLIDDGTGRVTVDPRGSSVKARIRQTGVPGQSPLTFTAFGGSDDEDEKWVEEIIYEGTSLYVLGYARPLQEARLSLRERTLGRLRQLKLDPPAMRRYDTNGDGHIDATEWAVARHDAEQEAMREHLADGQRRKRQEEHVLIARPPQRSLPFVIAETLSEAALVRKYGLISIPLLLAGAAAAALALYKFLPFVTR